MRFPRSTRKMSMRPCRVARRWSDTNHRDLICNLYTQYMGSRIDFRRSMWIRQTHCWPYKMSVAVKRCGIRLGKSDRMYNFLMSKKEREEVNYICEFGFVRSKTQRKLGSKKGWNETLKVKAELFAIDVHFPLSKPADFTIWRFNLSHEIRRKRNIVGRNCIICKCIMHRANIRYVSAFKTVLFILWNGRKLLCNKVHYCCGAFHAVAPIFLCKSMILIEIR